MTGTETPLALVTGGAGFIGSHLVQGVLRRGWRVRILDNFSTGKRENLEEATGGSCPRKEDLGGQFIPLGSKAEFLFGDITNTETCRRACEGVAYLFHLAAMGSVQRSVEDPLLSHLSNATGTLQILQGAREKGVQRVVYASSSSVYGNISSDPEEVTPKDESLAPHPESPYAAGKLGGEIYGRIFSDLYKIETVSLRFFNVFGPRQDPQSIYAAVVPRFMQALFEGQPPVIYGDGNQSRDFTFVDNVIQACLLAMEAPGISGQVLNVAAGQQIRVNDLLAALQKISGKAISPRFEAARSGEVRHSLAAIQLAESRLGYKASVGFHEGLSRTWSWYEKKRNPG